MEIEVKEVSKKYYRPTKSASHFEAVKPATLTVESGKLVEVMGRSGSGKSTLLYMCAGLLKPSSGNVFFKNDGTVDLYSLNDKNLALLRNRNFGIIPQGQTGLFALTVMQNVLVPCSIYGDSKMYQDRAFELLEKVGIASLADSRISELSGGELRRMSIARSLILNPEFIFADEPTDDLDDENTKLVLEILRKTADEGKAVFLVTHESSAEKYSDVLYKMDGGNLVHL